MPNDNYIIEEAVKLAREGVSVTLPVNGQSMLPFIVGGKESVILKAPGQVYKGLVMLAWADNSRYVVHRVVGIDGDKVTLMGDGNLKGKEYCKLSDLKAEVTHVVSADGKTRFLYTKKRMMAAKVWWYLRPIRRYLLFVLKLSARPKRGACYWRDARK